MKMMRNRLNLTIILTLLIAVALGCQFQCGSTPDGNSANTNSIAPNAKPSEKPSEKPKTETAANTNSETSKAESSKPAADSTDSAKTKTTTVKFEKGKTSAEYENSIGNGETQIFVVNVKEGQYLGAQTYSDTEEDVAFIVRKKGGANLEVPEGSVKWGGDIPESGDYEIVISGIKKTTKYGITISAE
jgi:hypothetical protein